MDKVKKSVFMLLVCVLHSAYAENDRQQIDSVFFISADMLCYFNNLEYFNKYREGEPFWGAYLQTRFSYRFESVVFSVGVHARKDFGDDSFFSDIRPLFRAYYSNKNFMFVLGELFNKERHGLLDALIRQQFIYDPVVEEGFQVFFKNKLFHQDFWASFMALNTPQHREHLCAGNATFIHLNPFVLSIMGYVSHYGGQQAAPVHDPVRENAAAALGIDYSVPVRKERKIQQFGIQQYLLGSYTSENRDSLPYDGGWGALTKIWLDISGFRWGFSFFKGNDYVTWEGNPMYRTSRPYYFLEISKHVILSEDIFFSGGLRLDFLDFPPSNFLQENQLWVQLGMRFDTEIR